MTIENSEDLKSSRYENIIKGYEVELIKAKVSKEKLIEENKKLKEKIAQLEKQE